MPPKLRAQINVSVSPEVHDRWMRIVKDFGSRKKARAIRNLIRLYEFAETRAQDLIDEIKDMERDEYDD